MQHDVTISSSELPLPPAVLVLDDDEATRASVHRAIRRRCQAVHLAATIAEAEVVLRGGRVDVALIDHGLPGGEDGLSFLRRLEGRRGHVFRILFTGRTEVDFVIQAINDGHIDAFLAKPWSTEALFALLHQGADVAHLRRRNRSLRRELEVRNRELERFNRELEDLVGERTATLEETNRQLRSYQDELVRLESQALVTQLIRGLAHELNNPLAVILGNVERLGRALGDDSKEAKRIATMRREVDRCTDIIARLRSYARPLGEDAIDCRLGQVLDITLERLASRSVELPGLEISECPRFHAAPKALAKALAQILDNAVRARASLIRISGRRHAERILLEIANDGATPSDEVVRQADRPFFSGWGDGSAGLGLSLARSLLSEQGATLNFDAGEPGAVVRISLQAADDSSDLVRAALDQPRRTASAAILLVDDEELVLELLADALEERGLSATCAGTAADARRVCREGSVAAVLLDANLGGSDGIELARELLADYDWLVGHLALMSGDPDNPRLRSVRSELGLPVLAKPFRLEDLTGLLEDLV